jgi:hypothetical protein
MLLQERPFMDKKGSTPKGSEVERLKEQVGKDRLNSKSNPMHSTRNSLLDTQNHFLRMSLSKIVETVNVLARLLVGDTTVNNLIPFRIERKSLSTLHSIFKYAFSTSLQGLPFFLLSFYLRLLQIVDSVAGKSCCLSQKKMLITGTFVPIQNLFQVSAGTFSVNSYAKRIKRV